MDGEGTLRGWTFENFVYRALLPKSKKKLSYVGHGKEKATVDIPIITHETLSEKNVPDESKLTSNTCYRTKEMEGVDIILKVETVYFIQCTVALDIGKKTDFWEKAKDGWVPILLVPSARDRMADKFSNKSNSALAQGYKSRKFYLADRRHRSFGNGRNRGCKENN